MIRAEGLTKAFGALVAVDGVDFEVRKGESFGLLGPNGAGKSTILR
ncbi:MAG: ATP-binding cassette domain-containing protein, partial [Rectinemataceae bacterium]